MRVRKWQNACGNECMSENEWEMRIACRAPTNSQNACKYARCVQVGKYDNAEEFSVYLLLEVFLFSTCHS